MINKYTLRIIYITLCGFFLANTVILLMNNDINAALGYGMALFFLYNYNESCNRYIDLIDEYETKLDKHSVEIRKLYKKMAGRTTE